MSADNQNQFASETYTARGQLDIDSLKSDTENFPEMVRSIYVGVAGNVVVVAADDSVATWTMPAGSYIDCLTKRVNSTNTTATGLIGLK